MRFPLSSPSCVRALALVSLAMAAAAPLGAAGREAPVVEIREGTAHFDATTNVAAINVHGKSTALRGRARIRETADDLVIEELEAAVPVKTLDTAMGLRDAHMRKLVFATPDGALPDVRFAAERASCLGSGAVRTCEVLGDLTIRDVSRPFTIVLKVKHDDRSFRVAGTGIVKLSTYGIERPSQLGITTMDDVTLRLEFVVTRADERIAQGSFR